MLGKLLKHEWKSTRMVGGLILLGMAAITLLGCLAFHMPMWKNMFRDDSSSGWMGIISVLTLIMYVLMLVGANYGILIYVAVHFYRTMYSAQGYLTHTLPVTKHQILGSKTLAGSLWVLAVMLATYLSVLAMCLSMVSLLMPEGYTWSEFWREAEPGLRDFAAVMKAELGVDVSYYFVFLLVFVFVSPFLTVSTICGAISMGQFFTKYRVLMGVVSYIVISVAGNIVRSVFQAVLSVGAYARIGTYVNMAMYANIAVNLLIAAAMYFVSWHVISHRLNLE